MAKPKKPTARLSEEGSPELRKQLDRIGEWSLEADEDKLRIVWDRPEDLVDELTLPVEFPIQVAVRGHHDSDERMFELWEAIHRRRASFLYDLRRQLEDPVVLEDDEEDDDIERSDLEPCEPKLVVRRTGLENDLLYEVEVVAEAGDDEHILVI